MSEIIFTREDLEDPKKCSHCKKANHIIVRCKCSGNFCLKHVQPENHLCTQLSLFKKEDYEKNKKKLENNATSCKKIEAI
jgi:predicted nucleic acid binding AN1-type Zn finger protein